MQEKSLNLGSLLLRFQNQTLKFCAHFNKILNRPLRKKKLKNNIPLPPIHSQKESVFLLQEFIIQEK